MRILLYALMSFSLMIFAWWAYKENYGTLERQDAVAELRDEYNDRFYYLQYLNAEWAHLTRAERLVALVEDNFDEVRLAPMTEANLARLAAIPYANWRHAHASVLLLRDPAGKTGGFKPE